MTFNNGVNKHMTHIREENVHLAAETSENRGNVSIMKSTAADSGLDVVCFVVVCF